MLALVGDAPAGVSFIYAVRSRAALDATRFIALGTAVILDDNQLAFDADDVARMCEWLEMAYTPADIARLIEETKAGLWSRIGCCAKPRREAAASPGPTDVGAARAAPLRRLSRR